MPFLDNGPMRIHDEVFGTGSAAIPPTGAGGDSRPWRDAA